MKARVAFVALAVAVAAVSASAKDDPASLRQKLAGEMRSRQRYPFADMKYFVDAAKLKDTRWQMKEMPLVPWDAQGIVFDAELSATDVPGAPALHVVVQRWPAYKESGGRRTPLSLEFKEWGLSVPVVEWEKVCRGFFEDWSRKAKSLPTEKSPPAKRDVGPSKIDGWAVGRDPESKQRERRDWFCWQANGKGAPVTYVAQSTTGEKFAGDDAWAAKVLDLLKHAAARRRRQVGARLPSGA